MVKYIHNLNMLFYTEYKCTSSEYREYIFCVENIKIYLGKGKRY